MNDWPTGWSRNSGSRSSGDDDRTVLLPQNRGAGGWGAAAPREDDWRYGGGPPPQAPPGLLPPRRRRRRIRPGRILALVLVGLLVAAGALYLYLDGRLVRVDVLRDYANRPAATPGQDWLIVGSDSRAGLTREERREMATGRASGRRTDSMMLLHFPEGDGKPTLVSLPRDSYVPIPGHGRDKLNAAYAFGGPRLLIRTVETVTGIRIDRYAEIGFGGFVGVVNAVGGVELCVKERMRDPKAGLDLKPGCQVLDGRQALGYVRTRASARADLDRVQRQRQFLSALLDKAGSPGVLANPFRSIPLAFNGTRTFTVDRGTHLYDLGRLGLGMGGGTVTTTVPIAGTPTVDVGSVVVWDREKALRLFRALEEDRPVPRGVIAD